MTSPELVLYVACLFLCKMAQMNDLSSSFRQESGFISTHVGRSIILQCFYDNDMVTRYYWYKQTLGAKPRLMATFYTYNKKGTFYDEYENDPRFTLDTGNGKNHLKISDLRTSDSATYYCASSYSVAFEFGEGATVSVQGSGLNIQASVHQSGSETIQPGGSVTLSCTVHTGTCDGEHSVYWFKDSEESHPGLIYTHGDRNDQCEKKPETQTKTCVYNLPMQRLNRSHAGTYYCAVASCGHILFGDGTKLEFEDEGDSPLLVYFLSGALTFTTFLVALLAFLQYKTNKSNSYQSPEARFIAPSTANIDGFRDEDNLHYAPISDNLPVTSSRQRDDTKIDSVYSCVRR